MITYSKNLPDSLLPFWRRRVELLYRTSQLDEETDEKYREGFWDLAGVLADILTDEDDSYALFDDFQEEFFRVFLKLNEKYDLKERKGSKRK